MKIFVLSVPHTQTTTEFTTCPFTMKTWNLCRALYRRGHEVIHLGVEGSNPECTEHVSVVPGDLWAELYGHPGAALYNQETGGKYQPYHDMYARNVRAAIEARLSRPYEAIVCATWGGTQVPATDGLEQFVVETGIGYLHTFARYRVFESYAWMHVHYGKEGKFAGNTWYDAVIPLFIDPAMFDFRPQDKQDYFLFMGRLNDDKGVAIAIDVARRVGRPIKIVGQGDPARFLKDNPHASYLPPVGVDGRKKLMAEAAAFLCPTQYVEPFGGVALEAQASGTPVICTDWGAFPETVLHGTTGYRCRTMDQFVWAAQHIDRIDPARCRKWVIDNFSMDRAVLMYEEYFQGLLNLNGRGWYEENPGRTQLDWLRKVHPQAEPLDLNIPHVAPSLPEHPVLDDQEEEPGAGEHPSAEGQDAPVKVSIIVPTYRREENHPGMYAVFRHQTYPHLELLIHDDGPQPSAFFTTLKDPRVKYFHDPTRLSIGAKLAQLADKATGTIIVNFDDDDFYAPTYVQTMVENLGEADIIILSGWYAWSVANQALCYWDKSFLHHFHFFLADKRFELVPSKDFFPDFVADHLDGYGFAYAYRKAVTDKVRYRDINLASDSRFVADLRAEGKTVKHFRDEIGLVVHVVHENSTSWCYPQFHLPLFLKDRLFPGFQAYLDAIAAAKEKKVCSASVNVSEPRLVPLTTPHALHPLVGRDGSSDPLAFHQIFTERPFACLDDVADPQLILDCGANVGYASAYFLSRFPQCEVIALEPDPGNFAILERNVAPYGARIQTIQAALWSQPAGLKMSDIPYRDGREWSRQVRACRADEAPELFGIDVATLLAESGYASISILKVDIEAAEKIVFASNYESWIGSVDNIVIELHDEECTRAFHNAIKGQPFHVSHSGDLTICRRSVRG